MVFVPLTNAGRDPSLALRAGVLLMVAALAGCGPSPEVLRDAYSKRSPVEVAPAVAEPAGVAVVPADVTPPDRLVALMQERLALMHDVARWKFAKQRPIEDAIREGELLKTLAAAGQKRKLSPAIIYEFFEAQFTAGKQIQEEDFEALKAAAKANPETPADPHPLPDLATEIRPRIEQISLDLLDELSQRSESEIAALGSNAAGTPSGISDAAWKVAMMPLQNPEFQGLFPPTGRGSEAAPAAE